ERVRHRHLAHGQLTERTVRQGDPPRPVLADLHRVPEAPVEVVELLRGVIRVDVDSPDDVAGDYTVALEGRAGDRRGDAVDLIRQRRVEPLDRLLDQEHARVRVVEV